jgi:hypothetical protein
VLNEARLRTVLADTKKELTDLESKTNPSGDDTVKIIRLKERIETIRVILGDERKSIIKETIRDMNMTEAEVIRGSLLVLESILVQRGFATEEELQTSLINLVKHLRSRNGSSSY